MNDKLYLSPEQAARAFLEYQIWAERAANMIRIMRRVDGLTPEVKAHLDAILESRPSLEQLH